MGNEITFLGLIKDKGYRIEIPEIQREYAQGRENSQVKDIRKSFVERLVGCITDSNKPLFLDYVYGRVEGDILIPFDGQQRLTTLFLFHLYIYKLFEMDANVLKNFSYKTRQSSKEFCIKIVEENIIPTSDDNDDKGISEYIKDQYWFYDEWKCDPTIKGMLVVLDEIQKQLKGRVEEIKLLVEGKNRQIEELFENITFRFLDLGNNKLPDETYIKMNARGKSLTAFENFKASLEEFLKGFEGKEKNEENKKLLKQLRGEYDVTKKIYIGGIDGAWLDFFYDRSNDKDLNKRKQSFGSLFLSTINRYLICRWKLYCRDCRDGTKESKTNGTGAEHNVFEDVETKFVYPDDDDYISWDAYAAILGGEGKSDAEMIYKTLKPLFNFFDVLSSQKDQENQSDGYQNYEIICKACQASWNEPWNPLFPRNTHVNNDNTETYKSYVLYYALVRFFSEDDFKKSGWVEKLKMWMRVVWNYAENVICGDVDTFISMLYVVDSLSVFSNDILNGLANHSLETKLGKNFVGAKQIDEERVKADKILSDVGWYGYIIQAEKFKLLKGRIWVLFANREDTTIDSFRKRLGLLREICSSGDDWNFIKVILSYKDTDCYGKLNLRTDNWKRLLTVDFSDIFNRIESNEKKISHFLWINDLCQTDLLNNSRDKIVKKLGDSVVLWGTSGCRAASFGNEVHGNVVIGDKRNSLLHDLAENGENGGKIKVINKKVDDSDFYIGININFEYEGCRFQWYRRDKNNLSEYDIYLMNNEWDYARRKTIIQPRKTDHDEFFCGNVKDDMFEDHKLFFSLLLGLKKEYEDDGML